MNHRALPSLLLCLGVGVSLTAAETATLSEGEAAIRRFRPAAGLQVGLVAAEPLLENVVSFDIDLRGRAYVVETHRRRSSVLDVRGLSGFWLDDDYSFRTVADRAEFFRRNISDRHEAFYRAVGGGRGGLRDFNGDGRVDWRDLEMESEKVRLLTDTDGDGRYDQSVVFAEGFSTLVSGVAAGVLAEGTNVWFTCIPDLWKFTIPSPDFVPTEPFNATVSDKKSEIGNEKLHSGFGVHIAFGGHDMHGLIKGPDGRIYWSIADRGTDWRPEFASTLFPAAFLRELLPDTGTIFRCDLDGSNIEVVAVGLRNPQELAFDDHGNLFTGDNNADGGDRARWVYVLPGSDSGWRLGWQWQNNPRLGAWNAEGLWWNAETNTGAWVLPHCGYLGRGPAGLAWYPGTGLPERYNDRFLMADFPDGVRSFGVEPRGAGFRVIDDQPFLWGIFATDVDFGPDGGAYVSDWVEGWDKTGKGRLYRVFDAAVADEPLVKETKALLASDFAAKTPETLTTLLGHRDQRVRLEAQWALANKGDIGLAALRRGASGADSPPLARSHGVWGLAQLARQAGGLADGARETLMTLLASSHAEVRAQAARSLGDLKLAAATPGLIPLLGDSSPRVRSLAAISLGQVQAREATPALLAMLRANADQDPWLRHAGVMGLVGCATADQLAALSEDGSEAVRVAAVLALRRRHNEGLTRFLADPSLIVRAEVVRAIYEEGLDALYSKLLSDLPVIPDGDAVTAMSAPLQRTLHTAVGLRVANAHFRLGRPEDAVGLTKLLAKTIPTPLRTEAAALLGAWTQPPKRDRVTGHFAPLPPRALATAAPALDTLFAVLADASEPATLRIEALRALATLQSPKLTEAIALARESPDTPLKRLADTLASAASGPDLRQLTRRLESGSLSEQQAALAQLGRLPDAESVLSPWLDKLLAGQVPPELALDVREAAAQGAAAFQAKLAQLDAKRDAADPLAPYRETLAGGDAINGRKIFVENQALACQRCHSIQPGDGGEVGPLLGGIGTRLTREALLESIVAPNTTIAAGYENVVLTTKDGHEVFGMVRSETADAVEVLTVEDGLVTVRKADIQSRERGPSSMLEGLGEQMSRRELRDLVEFLATLR